MKLYKVDENLLSMEVRDWYTCLLVKEYKSEL